ncbi:MAG: flagellar FliJ family protein [Pirellulaceae bacterium]
MSFEFRFASILQLHRHNRDGVQQEVARLATELKSIESERAGVKQRRRDLHQEPLSARVGIISVDKLRSIDQQDLRLRAIDTTLTKRESLLRQELAERRSELLVAQQDVQRFEKLQESDLAEHQILQNRAAQDSFDEQAAAAFQRRNLKRA